jgi:hypothetical protein
MSDLEPGTIINIDMDRPCSRCGKKTGTAENGLCLECLRKGLGHMATDQQLSLTMEWVDLDDTEKMERGRTLAHLIREQKILADDHAERKKDMKEERETLEQKIAAIAEIVRLGKEERPKAHSR